MPRRNQDRYDPVAESSDTTGARALAKEKGALVLLRWGKPGERSCACGCGGRPTGKKARFVMGHDQRLRGMLQRAHLTGTPIVTVDQDDGREMQWTASAYAHGLGWDKDLERAEEIREKRNRDLLHRAQVSDRTIQVGRWDYTGQVVAIFRHGDKHKIQFVTKTGEVRTRIVDPGEEPHE